MDASEYDSQAFNKLYEALKIITSQNFNSVLAIWKSVLDQTSTGLDVGEVLAKANDEYHCMLVLKTWQTNSR